MPTLEELKRENQRLRNLIKSKKEMEDIGKERNRLLQENKALLRQAKYSKQIAFAKGVGRATGKVGMKLGKRIWNTLGKLEQQRLRNEALHKKIIKQSRKKRR